MDAGPYSEEAPCGTIPALYALLLAKPPLAVDDTSSFTAVAEGVMRAGLTLVHFSAQPERFLTQNTP